MEEGQRRVKTKGEFFGIDFGIQPNSNKIL